MATMGFNPISSLTWRSSSVSFHSNFPLTMESANKNGSGSTKKSLDVSAKTLGVNVYGYQIAHPGSIIVRQRATKSKRPFALPQRTSKVVAFYGLTSPPYKLNALEPYMSQRTLELHWGKHHQGYVESLNRQLVNNPLYGLTMEELIKKTYNNGNPLPEFNNAAQVWNHDFFWESMQPDGGNLPWGGVLQQIEKDFSSFSNFRDEFTQSALSLFGSGWVWLTLKRKEKRLSVVRTSNAISPLVWGDIPIIGLDMWEHAYYLDYKDDTEKYVSTFMDHLVSWHAVTGRLIRAEAFVNLGEPKIPVA